MRTSFSFAVAALAVLAIPALAQSAPASSAPGVVEHIGVVQNPPIPVHADASVQGSGLKTRIGKMFTGAVVGGWLGYFASQVAVSDWDAPTDGSIANTRGVWAAAGVLSGAVLGRFVNGGAERGGAQLLDMTRGRSILTREQIVGAGAANAHQLISAMRPEWMQPRGVNSFTETATGYGSGMGADARMVVTPGEDHVLVYIDNARVGGTQHLSDLPLADVQQIEFIPGPQASFRWGAGHAHGVILITSMNTAGR